MTTPDEVRRDAQVAGLAAVRAVVESAFKGGDADDLLEVVSGIVHEALLRSGEPLSDDHPLIVFTARSLATTAKIAAHLTAQLFAATGKQWEDILADASAWMRPPDEPADQLERPATPKDDGPL